MPAWHVGREYEGEMPAGPRRTRVGGTVVCSRGIVSYSKEGFISPSGCPYWAITGIPENTYRPRIMRTRKIPGQIDHGPGGDGSTSGCGRLHARASRAPVERCCGRLMRRTQPEWAGCEEDGFAVAFLCSIVIWRRPCLGVGKVSRANGEVQHRCFRPQRSSRTIL